MSEMVEVTKEDANNYCRILSALGMEEEGDPVAAIEKLLEQPVNGADDVDPETGLSSLEKECLDSLVSAFNEFASLDRQHPNELSEFADSIHRLQGLLTIRIARRVYPNGWPTHDA